MPRTLPYGTWPSPLSAAALADGAVSLGDLTVDGDTLLWTEGRPSNGGRATIVRWQPGGDPEDLTPPDFNARTRVHEYGGAAFAARDGVVVASRFDDQRLHRVQDGAVQALTAAPPRPAGDRFADAMIGPDGRWLVAVHEHHRPDGEPRNDVVAVDLLDGRVRPLVTGRDFVAAPRFSPDGRRLAWLAWDHPNMPWDAAELWVADVVDGDLVGERHVAGGWEDAACSPVWSPDGALDVSLDGTGFWEVHRIDDAGPRRLSHVGADIGAPMWNFGVQEFAHLPDGRIVTNVTRQGRCELHVLDPETGTTSPISTPWVELWHLRSYRGGVAFQGRDARGDSVIAVLGPDLASFEVVRAVTVEVRDGDVSEARLIEVPLSDGETTHAWLFLPRNADVVGPDDEAPPLLVMTHGGPTAHVGPVMGRGIGFWTTRGFAVANVNYRGSTGHGRMYRERLRGQWGVVDVEDTAAVARHLADQGLVDGARMAIRGGSAGGFTTLANLTSPDHPFAAGASHFGVADLLRLAEGTHKFESRYLDQVVGPLPEARDLYVDRSPITHVDRLDRPVLVLQGLDDEVVLPEQAEAIVEAARARGLPHAYVAFEGEGHGFRKAESIITAHEAELSFHAQVFGFEPDGDVPPLELRTS